jgi:hypothetical protein
MCIKKNIKIIIENEIFYFVLLLLSFRAAAAAKAVDEPIKLVDSI